MSNYTNENLINVPASNVPRGTLAMKVGDNIFTAGNVVINSGGSGESGGVGSSLVDLIQVTSYTAPVPSFTVPEVYSMSGMTSAANPWDPEEPGIDFSVLNGTYTVTSDTMSATDPLNRVYKHDSANYYLRHYSDEYDHYWLLGSTADMSVWDAMLSLQSDQPLNGGTQTWNNMNYDMSQTVTAAITSSATIPAVPMTLTGQKITSITESAYDSSRGVRSFIPDGTNLNLSAADETPVVSGLAMASGGRMLMQLRNSCTQTYGQFSSGINTYNRGSVVVSSGWVYLDTVASGYGDPLIISSGGIADQTTIKDGVVSMYSGGTANHTTVNYGYLHITGATANYTTFNSGGYLVINSGTANYTTFNSGGTLTVSSGATANYTTFNSGGYLYVSSGGMAVNVLVSEAGRADAYQSGYIDSCTVMPGGLIDVHTTVNHVTVSSGGTIFIRDGEGAVLSNSVIEDGAIVEHY